jgi:hypothetical protein
MSVTFSLIAEIYEKALNALEIRDFSHQGVGTL